MIKLDSAIWEEVQLDEQKGYWKDFDNNGYTFTMEVNDSLQDDDINELIQLMEVYTNDK